MNNNIVLSICIPTFNRRDTVYECVTKILDNYQNDDIEVIVTDNCSVDGTKEKLSTIHDKRFRYYKNNANTKYINLLIAMSHANGQFSMLLSDEDDINIILLKELVQYLDGKDNIALIKSDVYNEMEGQKVHFRRNVSSYYYKITAILLWGYLSGVIYNNRFILPILRKINFDDHERLRRIIGEYPHIWLALMICHKGWLFFYQKGLIVQSRECKSDNVADKNKPKEFPWSNDRKFKQIIAMCKSFKHLQLSQLDSNEKIGLYCNRIRNLMKGTCSAYYHTLYGETYELMIRNYHPEDMENLMYWRKQPQYIVRNIYLSYRIVNRYIINSLWESKMDFIKDYMKNYGSISRLYYDTIKEYQKTRKYLKEIKLGSCNKSC